MWSDGSEFFHNFLTIRGHRTANTPPGSVENEEMSLYRYWPNGAAHGAPVLDDYYKLVYVENPVVLLDRLVWVQSQSEDTSTILQMPGAPGGCTDCPDEALYPSPTPTTGAAGAVGDEGWSMSAWVYRETTENALDCLFDFYTDAVQPKHVRVDFNDGLRIWINRYTDGSRYLLQTGSVFPHSTWVNVAITQTRDGSNAWGWIKVYINNVETISNQYFGWPQSSRTRTHWIGRSEAAGDPWFDGQMRDFFWWDRALTAAELAAVGADNTAMPATPVISVAKSTYDTIYTWSQGMDIEPSRVSVDGTGLLLLDNDYLYVHYGDIASPSPGFHSIVYNEGQSTLCPGVFSDQFYTAHAEANTASSTSAKATSPDYTEDGVYRFQATVDPNSVGAVASAR